MNWPQVYRSFDDATLETLANAGLLRRAAKDVEAGKVGWRDDAGGALLADGHNVVLDGGGPQKGRCDCPAPGICKHILAGALWLRALPASPGLAELDETCEPPGVLDEVLALDSGAACKQAGKAAARQALVWLQDSAQVDATIIGARLQIELPALKLACSYLRGAGVDGMVSSAPAALRKALHLYGLACVWRQHGREFAWPDGLVMAAQEQEQGLGAAELLFIAQTRRLLGELYDNGLSHASAIASGQLRALTMSARAENLPRLAAMLRGLGGTLDLLVRRDYQASERQAFDAMATIHALCAALETASGVLLQRLRGQARRHFGAQDAALALLPLGAYWWETRGGARGLTLSFWDHEERRVLQAVLARPDASDRAFTREAAWSEASLWRGAGSAQSICEHGLLLSGASLSGDGRLAMDSETSASGAPLWALDDPRWQALGFDDWAALAGFFSASTGLAVDPIDCVVLRPAAVAMPRLDELRQLLEWQLIDGAGAVLTLHIPALAEQHRRIERLQQAVTDGADIRAVLARQAREGGGPHPGPQALLQPVALLIAKNGALRVVSLDFRLNAGKTPAAVARFFKNLNRQGAAMPLPMQNPASPVLQALEGVLDALAAQARSGRPRLEAELAASLARHVATLRALGLDLPAVLLAAYLAAPRADNALRLAHVCACCIALHAAAR